MTAFAVISSPLERTTPVAAPSLIRTWITSPAQQAVHIFLTEIANAAAGLEHSPEISPAWIVYIRRRERQRLANHFAHFAERLLELRIFGCVFLREVGDLLR